MSHRQPGWAGVECIGEGEVNVRVIHVSYHVHSDSRIINNQHPRMYACTYRNAIRGSGWKEFERNGRHFRTAQGVHHVNDLFAAVRAVRAIAGSSSFTAAIMTHDCSSSSVLFLLFVGEGSGEERAN